MGIHPTLEHGRSETQYLQRIVTFSLALSHQKALNDLHLNVHILPSPRLLKYGEEGWGQYFIWQFFSRFATFLNQLA